MMKSIAYALTLSLAAGLTGCGSDDTETPDMGVEDMGMQMIPDAGVVAKCPLPENARTCETNEACLQGNEMLNAASANCGDFCPSYAVSRSCGDMTCPLVCEVGECKQLPTILGNEPLNLLVDRGGVRNASRFVVVMMHGTTTGGAQLTCDDVTADLTGFFDDPCYTVLDVRGPYDGVNEGGDVFGFSISRMPAGESAVAVVYGFESDDTSAGPVGVSCTELTIPDQGAGMGTAQRINANNMELIQ